MDVNICLTISGALQLQLNHPHDLKLSLKQ